MSYPTCFNPLQLSLLLLAVLDGVVLSYTLQFPTEESVGHWQVDLEIEVLGHYCS